MMRDLKPALRNLATLFSEALNEFGTHDGPWLAGAIAYYAAFSVFPLLLVLLAAFGFLLRLSPGARDAQSQFLGIIAQNTTPQIASHVAEVLAGIKLDAVVSGPVGLIALLLGATGLFAALDGAFDHLWDVPAPKPGILRQVRLLLRQRLNAFIMLLALGLLMVLAFGVGLVFTTAAQLAARVPGGQVGWGIIQVGTTVAVDAAVLAVMYRVLPKPDVGWGDVWFAAVLVAIVWEIGKQVLAFLVIGQNFSAYGVIGAFIALLAWIYYASLLFFVGAELVRVNCRRREAAACQVIEAAAETRSGQAGPPVAPDNNTGGTMKTAFSLIKETFKSWSEDKATRLAAALAYYTIFSIAPLLIVVIGIAGLVYGRQAVQGQLVGQIQGLVGEQGAALIQTMIASASKPSTGIIATVIGIVTLLLGAAGLFGQLQDSLNTIWEVMPAPGRPITAVIKDRLLGFGMVLAVGFLLLVSLVVSAALSALTGALSGLLPIGVPWLWQLVNIVISFAVITLLFALIFKYLPDVNISWRDVWVGAIVTSLLFTLGKFLIGLYLGHTGAGSAYGAAGSLVILLLWIYYSAQILFLGAEFTQVYARRYGTAIEPSRGAIALTEETRSQQGIPHAEAVKRRAPAGKGTTASEQPGGAAAGQAPDRAAVPGKPSSSSPRRAHVFAASSTPEDRQAGGAKGMAAAAAAAVLFTIVAATRMMRRH